MRVSDFHRFDYNLNQHNQNIAKIQKEMNDGGIDYDDVSKYIKKLNHDDNVNILDQQLSSLRTSLHNHNLYDTNLQAINEEMFRFNDLLIQRENDSLSDSGIEAINQELNSIIQTISDLEGESLNKDELLYNYGSQVLVGNNQYMQRSYGPGLIEINGTKISEFLSTDSTLDDIENVQGSLSLSLGMIGSEQKRAEHMIDTKELQKVYEEKYLANEMNFEESVIEMNEAIKTYEAHMLMYKYIKDLSLVNYI